MNNILYINTVDYPNNAVAKIINNLRNGLKNTEWDSVFAVGRHSNSGTSDIRIGNILDMYSHTILSRLFDSEGRHSINATNNFIKDLERRNIDLIHIHNLHGHYINYPILFEWIIKNNIPTIITLHDCWLITGHCATYYHNSCCPPQHCLNCSKHNDEYPNSWLPDCITRNRYKNIILKQKIFSYNNLHFVAVSEWLKNQVLKTGLTNNISVIPNGVDTTIFNPPEHKIKSDIFKILFITNNWESWKKLDSVIEFSKILRDDESISIVGNVYGRRLPKRINYIKNISNQQEVKKLYWSHDLFISPSAAETFGMTTAEAMACGLPVIVNNSAGLPELVTEYSGLITDTSKPRQLREAVDYIRTNYKSFSPYKHFTSRYSADIMCQNYINLYNQIKNYEKHLAVRNKSITFAHEK